MRKSDFIQHVLIRSLPALNKVQAGVEYAEALWQELSKLGYGAAKQATPTDNTNHYQALSEHQRKHFDLFWVAFNYKHDRNGAAMRWAQLGELSESDYQTIISAAKKEAKRILPYGQSRKMAQGWLFEHRYNDYNPNNNTAKHTQHNAELSHLQAELTSLQRLNSYNPNQGLTDQINKVEQQIQEINHATN